MAAILKFFNRKPCRIESKHDGKRHRDTDSELLKAFRSNIQEEAILKFFRRHLLPNHKSDWAETWLEAMESYRHLELLKSLCVIFKMAALADILKYFKRL